MPKQNIFSLALPILILLSFPAKTFSQNTTSEEIFTIETYYPAPYGVYNEMRAKRMAVGDTYYNGSQYCWSGSCSNPINATTDLIVQGRVGIGMVRPQANLEVNNTLRLSPTDAPNNAVKGAMYYADSENIMKYHDGSGWLNFVGLPPNYQWITIGQVAFALKNGATATTTCSVRDSWQRPAGVVADAKHANGQFQVRAHIQPGGSYSCDSGWITGTQASCQSQLAGYATVVVTATVLTAGTK